MTNNIHTVDPFFVVEIKTETELKYISRDKEISLNHFVGYVPHLFINEQNCKKILKKVEIPLDAQITIYSISIERSVIMVVSRFLATEIGLHLS